MLIQNDLTESTIGFYNLKKKFEDLIIQSESINFDYYKNYQTVTELNHSIFSALESVIYLIDNNVKDKK